MTTILLTNDDGYKSVGFLSLLKELSQCFAVTPVAPYTKKSWVGKSITAGKKLELKRVKLENFDVFSLNGTPADCVQVGLYDVLSKRPKLVVSGINIGQNLGYGRILSSGTIGAAMEASIDGVKSIASSLYIPPKILKTTNFLNSTNHSIFENAAKITSKLVRIIIKKELDRNVDLISINIPFSASLDSDYEVTKPYRDPYGRLFHKKRNKFMHIAPTLEFTNLKKGTDLKALSEGKISITPISLELVHDKSLKKIESIIKKEW